jgi:hypothetical protein
VVAEAVDFAACHLGCFAFGVLAKLSDGGCGSETVFDKPTDRLSPRRTIFLLATPFIDRFQERYA